MPNKKEKTDINTLSVLERKMLQLEDIVNQNNREDSLEQSVKQFEDGLTIAKECMQILDTYKGKIVGLKKEADRLVESEWEDYN